MGVAEEECALDFGCGKDLPGEMVEGHDEACTSHKERAVLIKG